MRLLRACLHRARAVGERHGFEFSMQPLLEMMDAAQEPRGAHAVCQHSRQPGNKATTIKQAAAALARPWVTWKEQQELLIKHGACSMIWKTGKARLAKSDLPRFTRANKSGEWSWPRCEQSAAFKSPDQPWLTSYSTPIRRPQSQDLHRIPQRYRQLKRPENQTCADAHRSSQFTWHSGHGWCRAACIRAGGG